MDKIQYVSKHQIRRLFNESVYPSLINDAKLIPQLLRNDHLKQPEKVNEPWCTHSQMIRYLDHNSKWVVEVFQYLRPDNTIGASGKPDPKRIQINDTIYIVNVDG